MQVIDFANMLPGFIFLVLCICSVTQAASSIKSTATQTIRTLAPYSIPSSVIESIHRSRASHLAKPKITPKPAQAASSFHPNTASKHAKASHDEVQNARKLVATAHESQAAYNIYRANNPRRNLNLSKKSEAAQAAKEKRSERAVPEPDHSQEVLKAIGLLGDIDAISRQQNGTLLKEYAPHNFTGDHFTRTGGKLSKEDHLSKRVRQDSFWIAQVHADTRYLGSSPFGGDPNYKVSILHSQ